MQRTQVDFDGVCGEIVHRFAEFYLKSSDQRIGDVFPLIQIFNFYQQSFAVFRVVQYNVVQLQVQYNFEQSVKSRYSSQVTHLRENVFSLSPLSIMMAMSFQMPFIMSSIPFYPYFVNFFFMKDYILQNSLLMSTEMAMRSLFFLSIGMLYYSKRFLDGKPTLHSWDISHLVIVYNSLQVLIDSVCSYLSHDSVSKLIKYIYLQFYFLNVLTGLIPGKYWSQIISWYGFALLFFCRICEELVFSLVKCLVVFTNKAF